MDEQMQKGVSIAKAYTQESLTLLEDLEQEFEELAESVEENFPGTEWAESLTEAASRVTDAKDDLEQLDWPDGIEAHEYPPEVEVASVPLVTRGPRKGLPKKVSEAEERRVRVQASADYLAFAVSTLELLDQTDEVSEVLQALGGVDLAIEY